jgi:hypothetical protein
MKSTPGVDFLKVVSVKRIQIWKELSKVGRKAQIHDAKLGKKDGRRAQIKA